MKRPHKAADGAYEVSKGAIREVRLVNFRIELYTRIIYMLTKGGDETALRVS